MLTDKEVILSNLLFRALDMALPDGLTDPDGCWAEGSAFGSLFDDAREALLCNCKNTNAYMIGERDGLRSRCVICDRVKLFGTEPRSKDVR